MRLGTHLKSARTRHGLTQLAAALISEVSPDRLATLEEGDRLPSSDELAAVCRTYAIPSPTVFLWMCHEIVGRVAAGNGEEIIVVDEDLLEALDQMTTFLAQRGRL